MGYVFGLEDAQRYNDWFQSEPGRSASAIERDLLLRLWAPPAPQKVLDVGCGTGLLTKWLDLQGHLVTGIDPSLHMVDVARKHLPDHISLDRGYAEHLPYDDNAFDTVLLVTTLEFVDDPLQALREAFRVAHRSVLLGSLNKYSIQTWHHYLRRFWKSSVYDHARFFGIFELRALTEQALSGSVPVRWRTCFLFPMFTLRYLHFLERSPYMQWHPFGHFIAMRIDLDYPLRTIQEPLFCDIPARIRHARFHASCHRSLRLRNCGDGQLRNGIFEAPGGKPEGPVPLQGTANHTSSRR